MTDDSRRQRVERGEALAAEVWRAADAWERALMERLLDVPDFSGRAALLRQWSGAVVQSVTDDGTFLIRPNADAADAHVRHRIPTEGEIDDRSGAIHVLLHVTDGRMSEVEIYHDAGEPVVGGFPLDRMNVWQPENWPRDIGWK